MPIKYEVVSASSIQNPLETIDFIENFKLFFYFFIFSNANISREISLLAIVKCSVKSPPVRGESPIWGVHEVANIVGCSVGGSWQHVINHVMPSLLSEAFRGVAPLQTTVSNYVLPFFCRKNGIWLRRWYTDTPAVQWVTPGIFNHVLSSLLSGAFRGDAPLQTTDFNQIINHYPWFSEFCWRAQTAVS